MVLQSMWCRVRCGNPMCCKWVARLKVLTFWCDETDSVNATREPATSRSVTTNRKTQRHLPTLPQSFLPIHLLPADWLPLSWTAIQSLSAIHTSLKCAVISFSSPSEWKLSHVSRCSCGYSSRDNSLLSTVISILSEFFSWNVTLQHQLTSC